MLLGILSDTHDHLAAMKAAMAVLREHGAEYYIHCGDVGGEQIIDQLAGVPGAFVWGNNDFDRVSLQRYAQSIGVACYGNYANLELAGKRIAVIHGDDFALKRKLLDGQQHDYLFLGHSHIREDTRQGNTRIINPGALYRAREKSVALLDLATDQLRFLVVGAN